MVLRRPVAFITKIGQATAFVLGIAALLALVLSPAAIGLAAVGDPILAGKANNVAGKATSLVAGLADPLLRLTNKGQGPALALDVKAGRPPLTVPKDAGTATNFDADELDGRDAALFAKVDTPTYSEFGAASTGIFLSDETFAICDSGDRVLTGGYLDLTPNGQVLDSSGFERTWRIEIRRTDANSASARAHALCLDFPPLRGGSDRR